MNEGEFKKRILEHWNKNFPSTIKGWDGKQQMAGMTSERNVTAIFLDYIMSYIAEAKKEFPYPQTGIDIQHPITDEQRNKDNERIYEWFSKWFGE